MRHDGAHEAIDERRLQAQLLGIRDVLPGAANGRCPRGNAEKCDAA